MPTLRSFSSSPIAIISRSFLFLCSCLHLMQRIPFVNDAQSLEREEFIHFVDGGTFGSHEGSQSACRYNFGVGSIFFLNALDKPVNKTHVTVKDSGLNRVDGVLADNLFGFHDFDSRQFRRALE